MKSKKSSRAVFAAFFLSLCLTAVFLASAKEEDDLGMSGKRTQALDKIPIFPQEGYKKLLALKLDGYGEMAVREYNNARLTVRNGIQDYRHEFISDGLMSGEYYWLPLTDSPEEGIQEFPNENGEDYQP